MSKISHIWIRLSTDDETMVGSGGWGKYDATVSANNYRDAVYAEVTRAYPGADVLIDPGNGLGDQINVSSDDYDYEAVADAEEHVRNIIEQVYESQVWMEA